jgi:hypothetical protein
MDERTIEVNNDRGQNFITPNMKHGPDRLASRAATVTLRWTKPQPAKNDSFAPE